MVIKIQ